MTKSRPNVVLIFVDNHPAMMLGCAGNAEIHTPNLDNLARGAARFSEAYCPSAMCSPCRASVLTGLMPSQHGIHTWIDDSYIDTWPKNWNAIAEFETIATRLQRNGYDTALVGKYHLGIADEPQNGFRHWVTLQIGHVLSFYDNQIIDNGQTYNVAEHSVDFFTRKATEYIGERSKTPDQPFFLYLTYPAPYGHWPSIQGEPDNRFAPHYTETPFQSVPREALSKEFIQYMLIQHDKGPYQEGYFEDLGRIPNDLPTLRNYYSQMSMVDEGVGKVLDALRASGQWDDTLVIYTSDHGMSLGTHGFWGHGEDTWPSNTHREAHHIPLIIKPPTKTGEGTVRAELVGTTDIYATILDYAVSGTESNAGSPSRSLRPILEGRNYVWNNTVYMEQEETRAIRTDRWLLMCRVQSSPYAFRDELFDLESDPDERNNVADCPELEGVLADLKAKLHSFFDEYASPKWNLWRGGSTKSNSTRPFLWREMWGDHWAPEF